MHLTLHATRRAHYGASRLVTTSLVNPLTPPPRPPPRQTRYPLDFAFDPSDEDEGEEDMLRQQLRKHYVNAVRQAPEMALDFLCRALSALPTPLSALPFPDLEASLRLIFHFGEGCGGVSGLTMSGGGARRGAGATAGAAELLRTGAFPQMVVALHDSDVAQHKHPQVCCALV